MQEITEALEVFKGNFPLMLLLFVPFLIIISPVDASHGFSAYRMQEFDLQGVQYGCRNAIVNMEARPLSFTSAFTRRCVIARMTDLTIEKYRELIDQSAGALLILLPVDLESLTKQEFEDWLSLETQLLDQETKMPVYFAWETQELKEIYAHIENAVTGDDAKSAAEALLSVASSSGYQMAVAGPQAKPIKDMTITSFQGKLSGKGIEEHLPTLAVIAHYDSFGIAPYLSFGADSNGSGVVALLELARLFSRLYAKEKTRPEYNLLFLLSGGGKYNFQGTKRWIEDSLDSDTSIDFSLLADVDCVLCLDTIGAGQELNFHVSKPPKEGSVPHLMMEEVKRLAESWQPSLNFSMVHKKINLAEDMLAWEHERFSIRRLPALTVSHLQSHRDPRRTTIMDRRSKVDVEVLSRNIRILAEAMAQQLFGLNASSHDSASIFTGSLLQVSRDSVESWLDYLSSMARSTPITGGKASPLAASLEQALSRHLSDVRRVNAKADKRDPEFVFYDGMEFTMNAYSVKPALFDLFLAAGIAAYLGLIYLAVQNFSLFYGTIKKLVDSPKAKSS